MKSRQTNISIMDYNQIYDNSSLNYSSSAAGPPGSTTSGNNSNKNYHGSHGRHGVVAGPGGGSQAQPSTQQQHLQCENPAIKGLQSLRRNSIQRKTCLIHGRRFENGHHDFMEATGGDNLNPHQWGTTWSLSGACFNCTSRVLCACVQETIS